MNKFSVLFLTVCIFFVSSAYSDRYIITDTEYNINGITRESILRQHLDIETKRIFDSEEELLAYISGIEQKLVNTRLFEDVKIDFTYGKAENDLPYPVTLIISTADSHHLLILPYPKYDSNTGVTLKIKINDDNFLGFMNKMSSDISFGVEQRENRGNKTQSIIGASFDYNFPITTGRVNTSWNNSFAMTYAIEDAEPEWDLGTGFTIEVPLENISYRLDLKQGYVKNLDYKKYDDDTYFVEYAEFGIPVKLERIDGWGDILYTPSVSYEYNWDSNGISRKNEDLLNPLLKFSHKLSTEHINWHGNFRKGIYAAIGQNIGYNFGENQIQPGFFTEFKGFYSTKYIGFNSRLYAFGQFNAFQKIGSRLRGIRDDQYFAKATGLDDVYACKTTAAIILNLDMPVKIFATDWKKIGWNFLHSFNFELQVSPFIDIALVDNRVTHRCFDFRDGFYTCGLEVIVFPEKWKSIQLRGSAGFDISRYLLKDYIDTSWRAEVSKTEITIGLGLFY